jgi:NAD(P)H-hydrate epimerase
MTVLVTPDEMRAAEAAAVAAGRTEPDLMRKAAERIASWINSHVTRRASARRFAIALVGPGNNGGDALVALALLIEHGWRAGAILLGRDKLGALPADEQLLDSVELVDADHLHEADVILDGVYGVGGRASLPDAVAATFRRAHGVRVEQATPLVAIDVPSGIDPETGAAANDAFLADVTLCLGLPKIGLIREPAATHTGELEVLDIGMTSEPVGHRPQLIDERMARSWLPRRSASAHKHQTGTVLVIGGAPTYYGAPRMTAEAAARAGAGLVCVAAPASIIPVIAGQVPELVMLPLDESASEASRQIMNWIDERGGHVDTFIVGPGLGQTPHATILLERLLGDPDIGIISSRGLRDKRSTFVLDADALNWIAKRGSFPLGVPANRAVMTPHAGELGRLLGERADSLLDETIESAGRAAKAFEQTVVFKTGYSVVASSDGAIRVSPRSAPELATAGTGDVLAGLIGGFLAQGMTQLDAASVALFAGAHAGKAARMMLGTQAVMATDVIDYLPSVLRRLSEPNWTGEGL